MTDSRPPLDPEAEPAETIDPELPEDWPEDGLGPVETVFDALPDPRAMPAGAWLAVRAVAPRKRGLMARLRRAAPARRAHLSVVCSALLARGFSDVCADAGAGVAFGRRAVDAQPG